MEGAQCASLGCVGLNQNRISGLHESYMFGRTRYLPGGRFGPRRQDAYQLVILIRGELDVTVGPANFALIPGEGLLQLPGGREFYRFSDEVESEHIWCQVWPQHLSRRDQKLLKEISGVYEAQVSTHLLIEEGLSLPNPHSTAIDHALEALARACLLGFAARTGRTGANPDSRHPAYDRAQAIAAVDFAVLKSTQDLAQRTGVSTSQLRFIFRQAGDESPSQMIWRLKIEHALRLVRSTGLTLGEIAVQCGYANAFHLSRSVRHFTGRAPRELRKIEWGEGKESAPLSIAGSTSFERMNRSSPRVCKH